MKKILFFLLIILSFNSYSRTPQPDTVKIGCYLISLHDFNFRDKEFTARFWVWFLYNNKLVDLKDQIEVPNAKTIEKTDVIIDQLDSLDWLQIKMKCTMKKSWQVADYPFDKQQLKIRIENSKFDSRSLVFVADTVGQEYDAEMTVDGWTITGIHATVDTSFYATAFGDPKMSNPSTAYSRYTVDIDLKRDAWGLFIKLFLGMYVAFYIACISFLIDNDNAEPRFGLPVGGVFAVVGNKYVIDSFLPETSELTLVDLLHGITLIGIFLIIFLAALSLYYYKKENYRVSKRINIWGGTATLSIFILLNVALILVALW